ncbi:MULTISPECIES: phage tail protein [unclassified Enterobacter]|uniref:phage tail protein n=1 Tax=unclassified Enterobacter TaxID=2608935 RepID=UPI0015C80488|nr:MULTISPECIES: phage tail protein [unclassified Enterobacter]MBB3306352.1 phage-related tail fiber protein [Enterobacter sp. Sphag1F]NYI15167.1 phage-related tail fiber protein [Enterobacter sp. Sphag71]
MTTKYFALLTNQGAAKLANAAALGTKVNITQMAVGDGGGTLPTPDPAQTKLIGEKRRASLNSLTIDAANGSQIIAEQIIPEGEGGFWIREIGLFDADGVMIAVANCAETYKPQLAEGSGRTQTVRMIIIVNSTSAVTLKIDPSVVLATRQYVDDKALEVRQYADGLLDAHIKAADPHTQYAPKASPTFTGSPKAPTAAAGNNSTQLANTAFVQAALAALAGSAPATLDTLKEIADALGNDPNFATTMLNALAGKMDKSGNGKDIQDVAKFRENLGLATAAVMAVGNGAGQIPDMSFFIQSLNGQNFVVKFPNGFMIQGGTVSLQPVGNFNPQTLGGQTYYTHFYRVPFNQAFATAQVTTVASLTCPPYDAQGSMAGRTLSVHRDQDAGQTGVAKTRFAVAVTHPQMGETPTIHWTSYGY